LERSARLIRCFGSTLSFMIAVLLSDRVGQMFVKVNEFDGDWSAKESQFKVSRSELTVSNTEREKSCMCPGLGRRYIDHETFLPAEHGHFDRFADRPVCKEFLEQVRIRNIGAVHGHDKIALPHSSL